MQLAILQIPYLLARDLWSPFLTLPLAYLSNFDASYYYRYCALLRSPEVQGKEIGFCQITLSFPLSFPPCHFVPPLVSTMQKAIFKIQLPEVEERKNLSIKPLPRFSTYPIIYYICPYAHRHDVHPSDKSWRPDRPMGHGNPRHDVS